MKTENLKKLLKHIVSEALDALAEGHQSGEWWITEDGSTIYADIDVGDSGHEGVIIQHLVHEILGHFNIHEDEPQELSAYEDTIKEILQSRNQFTDEDEEVWNTKGASEVILKKLVEDKAYPTYEQTEDALYIAYNSTMRDARNYGMKYLKWKIMKTHGKYIEIQSWHLLPEDLTAIVRGLWDVVDDTPDDETDEDSGTLINLTVAATQKRYHGIPLEVLEKKMAAKLQQYQSGVHVGYTEAINEDYHFHHKEYRMYEGNRHVVVAFDDNTRLKFEVHFRNSHGIDREKWRKKAMSTWKSCANELHRDVPLSDACNPIQKGWKECFKEAMKHPKMKPYIREKFAKLFDDKGYPASVQGKPQPVVDPVNFTPR
jgi:hypothetical protein